MVHVNTYTRTYHKMFDEDIIPFIVKSNVRLYDQFRIFENNLFSIFRSISQKSQIHRNNISLISFGVTLLPYHKTSQFASRAFSKKSFTIVNDKQTANFSTTSSFVYRNITIKKRKVVLSKKDWIEKLTVLCKNIYKWWRFFWVSKWTIKSMFCS